jgi:hypothetical protein
MGLLDAFQKRKEGSGDYDASKPTPVPEITKVIEAKRYSSMDAKCVAQGLVGILAYGWLMQTNKGNFFLVYQGRGLLDGSLMGPIHVMAMNTPKEIQEYYEKMTFQIVPFETVFPNQKVSDA